MNSLHGNTLTLQKKLVCFLYSCLKYSGTLRLKNYSSNGPGSSIVQFTTITTHNLLKQLAASGNNFDSQLATVNKLRTHNLNQSVARCQQTCCKFCYLDCVQPNFPTVREIFYNLHYTLKGKIHYIYFSLSVDVNSFNSFHSFHLIIRQPDSQSRNIIKIKSYLAQF